MPNMGVSLTDEQRVRLEFLAYEAGRSLSNMIGRLIDEKFVAVTGHQEKEHTDNGGAQNPEREPTV